MLSAVSALKRRNVMLYFRIAVYLDGVGEKV